MMKRLLTAAMISTGLAFGVLFVPVPVHADKLQDLPPSVIDKIEVPYDVVTYAQMEYQGYAVTKVSKTIHKGQKAYRLRVDRDSSPDDFRSIYLYYDSEWKLVDDSKMTAPEVVPDAETPSDEDKKKKERERQARSNEQPAYKPEPEVRKPDNDEDEEKPDKPEPTPEPEPEPEPTPEEPPTDTAPQPQP